MNTNKEVNKERELQDKATFDKMEAICAVCGGRYGLHNHMNQACPKDINASRDHMEYRKTVFARQSSIDAGVEGDLWTDIINYFNGTYADLTEREMKDAINFLKTKYRISLIAGAKWASSGEAVEQTVSMEEYNDAINEIGQLQEQLKEAEEEIRELSKFDER